MNMLIDVLKALGVVVLVAEVLLVLFMVVVGTSLVLEHKEQKNETRGGKHRNTQETRLERAKRDLRELKEKEASETRFFTEYWMQGFYNADEQARRDNQVMTVYTQEV